MNCAGWYIMVCTMRWIYCIDAFEDKKQGTQTTVPLGSLFLRNSFKNIFQFIQHIRINIQTLRTITISTYIPCQGIIQNYTNLWCPTLKVTFLFSNTSSCIHDDSHEFLNTFSESKVFCRIFMKKLLLDFAELAKIAFKLEKRKPPLY